MKRRGKKGFVPADFLTWWIIGIVVLVLVLLFYVILKGKGTGAIDFFKNLWRFR